jgi:L-2-hydroxycarboxylate dehydrogenase (NAD+)
MSIIVNNQDLFEFTKNVFLSYNLDESDASICSENLVMSDLRGIPSHGVARLKRYVDGMDDGIIYPLNKPKVIEEAPSTATVDGNAGLGQVVGFYSTNLAIQKAKNTGVGIVAVRNSNHYGIAGYYAKKILDEGMLGISLTNSAPLVVPTFGKEMLVGTNPISFSAPAGKNRPFLLDMATSVVPRGKLEVYNRDEKPLPEGWAVDNTGKVTTDSSDVLNNMTNRLGGGILPLGGEGELYSGFKGYGMAMIVDILCGVLSGGAYANMVNMKKDGKPAPANVSHFFMALKIENFVAMDTFKASMDDFIDRIKGSQKASGQNRIYIHGEKEYEKYDSYKKHGVPLQEKVYDTLKQISNQRKVDFIL